MIIMNMEKMDMDTVMSLHTSMSKNMNTRKSMCMKEKMLAMKNSNKTC